MIGEILILAALISFAVILLVAISLCLNALNCIDRHRPPHARDNWYHNSRQQLWMLNQQIIFDGMVPKRDNQCQASQQIMLDMMNPEGDRHCKVNIPGARGRLENSAIVSGLLESHKMIETCSTLVFW